MIRRRRHTRYPPAAGAAGGDTESLQTDVMRFMSIIGLCLMAVFALVQVIPVQVPGKPAQPSQAARLQQEIRVQQQQVRELQAELHGLKSEKERAQQVLTVAQRHLEQVVGKTGEIREQRERLDALDRQLVKERQALADTEQVAAQKEQSLDELRGRLLDTQVQLDYNRRETETLKHRSRQQAAKSVTGKRAPSEPEPEPEPVPARQGFTLRFASAAALDRLVSAESVALYGMTDRQAWRLSMDAGRPAAARASFPRWFHEMSTTTVPAHYLHSLEDTADGPGQSGVVWGVQLPVDTRAAIAALTRGQQGGELVIRSNGQVVLEE